MTRWGRLGWIVGLIGAAAAVGAAGEARSMDVTVNGVRLHCEVAGSGKTILFLHGFPEFSYAWRRQLAEFGRDHQAVAPDLRGYHRSERPEPVEAYAMSELVADARGLIDHFSPDRRAILVGHDWGGVIAWNVAIQYPERVEKLAIINAPHPDLFLRELRDNPAQREASAYMELLRSPQAEAVLGVGNFAMLARGVFESATRPDAFSAEDRRRYLEAWSAPGGLTGGLNYYRAAALGAPIAEDAPLPEPRRVRVPTLVVWGEQDTALTVGNLEGLDAVVDSLRVERIPDGSHWVIHEQPETVNRLLREYLAAPAE